MTGNTISSVPIISVTLGDDLPTDILGQLTTEIEHCLEAGGQTPNLVFVSKHASDHGQLHAVEEKLASALTESLHPRKIAFVDGAPAQLAASHLRNTLRNTLVRHFEADHLDAAKDWAGTLDDQPGRLVPLGDIAPHVVGFRAEGQITAEEYVNTLVQTVEERAASYGKLCLLLIFGPEFDSFSEAAIWKDMEFGLGHLGAFEKIAVVTQTGAFLHGEKVFAPLCWAELRAFRLEDVNQAYAWVGATQ
ncbi:MAG: STAS/SEC14 domain-containing protein [Novosphingobium sp.]